MNIYRELRIHLYYKSILGEAHLLLLTVKETTKFIKGTFIKFKGTKIINHHQVRRRCENNINNINTTFNCGLF